MDLHLSYICSCEIKIDNGFFISLRHILGSFAVFLENYRMW